MGGDQRFEMSPDTAGMSALAILDAWSLGDRLVAGTG